MSNWYPPMLPHDDEYLGGFYVGYYVDTNEYGYYSLFAAHDIPAGTLIWKYRNFAYILGSNDSVDKALEFNCNVLTMSSEEEARSRFNELESYEDKKYWLDHTYFYNGVLNEILDDQIYCNLGIGININSGCSPNSYEYCMNSSYSIRDIKAGEEILEDSNLYIKPDWLEQLYYEFNENIEFEQPNDSY
jgi:SET domain-containing protein